MEGDDEQEGSVDSNQEESIESTSTAQRGRKKIPLAWTKVINLTKLQQNPIKIYGLFAEIELQKHLRDENRRSTLSSWKMIFWPKDFAKQFNIEDLEKFRLNAKQMERHGVNVSNQRSILRKRALELQQMLQQEENKNQNEESKLLKRVNQGYYAFSASSKKIMDLKLAKEPTPTFSRKRGKKAHLSVTEKIDAIHKVVVLKESYAAVARHYRVSVSTISKYVTQNK